MRRRVIRSLAVLAAASLVSGCGFKLRGQTTLPFVSAYVDAPAGSALGTGLRQSLASMKKSADTREAATVTIKVTPEQRSKNILSLSGSGKVREYRLEYQTTYAVFAANGSELVANTSINLTREFSYNDDQVLAKEAEEAALNRAMEQDALRQVMRRLSYLKP